MFGEIQLNDIVSKALPSPTAIQLQATLSNGKTRGLPDPPAQPARPHRHRQPSFPLEDFEALDRSSRPAIWRLKACGTDAFGAVRCARCISRRSRREVHSGRRNRRRCTDVPVPSEAIYAELHAKPAGCGAAMGFSARVWIVSPTTCMATLNTMRAILKDARMREQAGCDPQGTWACCTRMWSALGDRVYQP